MTGASGSDASDAGLRFSRRHLLRRYVELLRSRLPDRAALGWYCSSQGRRNAARLSAMRQRYAGQRCFVLGNGPSLNRVDLTRLRDEWVIGLNRIYLHPVAASWRRWLYCCVNPHVLRQFGDEIGALPAAKFLPWEHRSVVAADENTVWLRSRHEPAFSYDLTDAVWQGATVTYVALQIAFYLGFTDVILVGVDHAFGTQGQPNTLVRSESTDENHFSPDYFGPGTEWQLPDLEQSETAYRLARQVFEQEGRRVRDATVSGRLEVFPKVRYDDLF